MRLIFINSIWIGRITVVPNWWQVVAKEWNLNRMGSSKWILQRESSNGISDEMVKWKIVEVLPTENMVLLCFYWRSYYYLSSLCCRFFPSVGFWVVLATTPILLNNFGAAHILLHLMVWYQMIFFTDAALQRRLRLDWNLQLLLINVGHALIVQYLSFQYQYLI